MPLKYFGDFEKEVGREKQDSAEREGEELKEREARQSKEDKEDFDRVRRQEGRGGERASEAGRKWRQETANEECAR